MRCHPRLLAASSLLAGLVLLPAAAVAQTGRVEFSPFAGYRWDGQADGESGFLSGVFQLEDSAVFGVRLDFAVTDTFQLELLASHQETRLVRGEGFFGPPPGERADVDVETLHLGFLFQRGDGQLLPYGVFSVGATRLDSRSREVVDDARLSASGGGGLKVFLNQHVGLRLEARAYWVDTDSSDDTFSVNDLLQKEATGGLIFAF